MIFFFYFFYLYDEIDCSARMRWGFDQNKDVWVNGVDSFLGMPYSVLQVMKKLLVDTGSIYVHLDWHCGHYVTGVWCD